jgi:hypothetical protein
MSQASTKSEEDRYTDGTMHPGQARGYKVSGSKRCHIINVPTARI